MAADFLLPFTALLPNSPAVPRHCPKLHLDKQEQCLVLDEVMSGFLN